MRTIVRPTMDNEIYIKLEDVIGDMVSQFGIPVMPFDNLVILGQRTVIVYGLDSQAKRLSFDDMCQYIKLFIATPFGAKLLKSLL